MSANAPEIEAVVNRVLESERGKLRQWLQEVGADAQVHRVAVYRCEEWPPSVHCYVLLPKEASVPDMHMARSRYPFIELGYTAALLNDNLPVNSLP